MKWLSFTSGMEHLPNTMFFFSGFSCICSLKNSRMFRDQFPSGVHITSVDCNNRWIPPFVGKRWVESPSVDGGCKPDFPTSTVGFEISNSWRLLESGLQKQQQRLGHYNHLEKTRTRQWFGNPRHPRAPAATPNWWPRIWGQRGCPPGPHVLGRWVDHLELCNT